MSEVKELDVDDLVGRTLGQYHILVEIGRGGMATVYKAYHPGLDRFVAIKVLLPQYAYAPGFVERFKREALAVARLRHPNILTVYDFGEAEGLTYIVMEFVAGGTLKERLGQPLAVDKAVELAVQVARALEHAHSGGIIHRDVKPSNVLMPREDWALLADFGVAKVVEGTIALTRTGVGIGTPEYMSPEQGQGVQLDGRSDIYSLGIMLYEMVTGQVPFKADTPFATVVKHMTEPLPLPRSMNPTVPEPLERVVQRAASKDPADRYQTAGEMAEALEKIRQAGAAVPAEKAARPLAPTQLVTPVRPPSVGAELAPMEMDVPPTEWVRPPAAPTPTVEERPLSERLPVKPMWLVGAAIGLLALVVGFAGLRVLGRGEPTAMPTAVVKSVATVPTAMGTQVVTSPTQIAVPTQATEAAALVRPTATLRPLAAVSSEETPTATPTLVAPTATSALTMEPSLTATPPAPTTTPMSEAPTDTPVRPTTTPAATDTPTSTPPEAHPAQITLEAGRVNIRSGPGTNYDAVGQFQAGDQAEAVARNPEGDWIEVRYNWPGGDTAWVFTELVQLSVPLSAIPTAAVTPTPPAVVRPQGKIAFTRFNESRWGQSRRLEDLYDIYIMDADGSNQRLLIEHASEPGFSPDGRQIVFYRWLTGLWIMNIDGSGLRQFTNYEEDAFPAWSPRNDLVLFTSFDVQPGNVRFNIKLKPLAGGDERTLTDGEQAAWAPDGVLNSARSRIVFKGCEGNDCGLMTINVDGSERKRITQFPNDLNPDWSPDGRRIVFASYDRDQNWEIYVINADGTGERRLTFTDQTEFMPVWLPDGVLSGVEPGIVFRSDRDGTWGIWMMDPDGGNQRKIADAPVNNWPRGAHQVTWQWDKMDTGK